MPEWPKGTLQYPHHLLLSTTLQLHLCIERLDRSSQLCVAASPFYYYITLLFFFLPHITQSACNKNPALSFQNGPSLFSHSLLGFHLMVFCVDFVLCEGSQTCPSLMAPPHTFAIDTTALWLHLTKELGRCISSYSSPTAPKPEVIRFSFLILAGLFQWLMMVQMLPLHIK